MIYTQLKINNIIMTKFTGNVTLNKAIFLVYNVTKLFLIMYDLEWVWV